MNLKSIQDDDARDGCGSAAANMAALFDFCGGASHVVAAPVLSSPASFVVAFGHGVQLPLLAVST